MSHQSEQHLKAERALFRQSISHHLARERVLEQLLADYITLAQHKPRCHCEASKALRQLAQELETPERAR